MALFVWSYKTGLVACVALFIGFKVKTASFYYYPEESSVCKCGVGAKTYLSQCDG